MAPSAPHTASPCARHQPQEHPAGGRPPSSHRSERELFGLLGSFQEASSLLRQWNAFFRERGIDASFDRYPATEETLSERFSEMFHFDRTGYLVSPVLERAVVPILDRLEGRCTEEGRVDTIWNDGGVLWGFLLGNVPFEERFAVWSRTHGGDRGAPVTGGLVGSR